MFHVAPGEVEEALRTGSPVVALETAVLTHGTPHPHNLKIMDRMQGAIRACGATPAVIGMVGGQLTIGLSKAQIQHLGDDGSRPLKLSKRDVAFGMATRADGGTTVAATLAAANHAGISVLTTGGVGGFHRGWSDTFDVSADLDELASVQCAVICSGAKAILDLRATLEALESRGIPVLGYQTDHFPQFYSRGNESLTVPRRVDDLEVIASICAHHWFELGDHTSVVIANPCPQVDALSQDLMESLINEAIHESHSLGVTGAALTPFLLNHVARESDGRSLRANLALLESNARLAAQLAVAMAESR